MSLNHVALQSQRGGGARGLHVDANAGLDVSVRGQRPRRARGVDYFAAATAADGVSPLQCSGCGLIGKHRTPAACIAALRDKLAR